MSYKKSFFVIMSAVLILAPSIVLAQWTGGTNNGITNVSNSGLPVSSVYGIISNTLSWLLAVLGFIAVMGFVISGIQYLLAAGDEGMAERAKNAMKYSIIGVIVALMGYVVIRAIHIWLAGGTNF
ncbi:MAG: hypothetical protein WAT84_04595 [Candidatus Moraniibacteriota bacterium]